MLPSRLLGRKILPSSSLLGGFWQICIICRYSVLYEGNYLRGYQNDHTTRNSFLRAGHRVHDRK